MRAPILNLAVAVFSVALFDGAHAAEPAPDETRSPALLQVFLSPERALHRRIRTAEREGDETTVSEAKLQLSMLARPWAERAKRETAICEKSYLFFRAHKIDPFDQSLYREIVKTAGRCLPPELPHWSRMIWGSSDEPMWATTKKAMFLEELDSRARASERKGP